jgi:hypothetical protein
MIGLKFIGDLNLLSEEVMVIEETITSVKDLSFLRPIMKKLNRRISEIVGRNLDEPWEKQGWEGNDWPSRKNNVRPEDPILWKTGNLARAIGELGLRIKSGEVKGNWFKGEHFIIDLEDIDSELSQAVGKKLIHNLPGGYNAKGYQVPQRKFLGLTKSKRSEIVELVQNRIRSSMESIKKSLRYNLNAFSKYGIMPYGSKKGYQSRFEFYESHPDDGGMF